MGIERPQLSHGKIIRGEKLGQELQLYLSFPPVFSAGVVSARFDAAVSACALQLGPYSLNSALQNQIMTLADLLQAMHQTPEVPCVSGPVLCVEVPPCRFAGKETFQTQRLAAALWNLSDLECCSSPAGPDFLICEKV